MMSWTDAASIIAVLASLVGTFRFFLRPVFKAELLESEGRLMERINGKYMKTELADERHKEMKADIEDLYKLVERRTKE